MHFGGESSSLPDLRAKPGNMHRSVPVWYKAMDHIDRKFVIDAFMEGEKAILAKKETEDALKEGRVESMSATDRLTMTQVHVPEEKIVRKQSLQAIIREQTLREHAVYLKKVVQDACDKSVRAGHDEKWCCANPEKDHLLRTCTVLNPASRLHCINCGYPKPEGKNLIYRTLMTWLDWKKEHEPGKLKFSAWHKWKRNIKPAKMRFKKGIKKLIMINRFKVKSGKALTAIQQYEAAEQAKKDAEQKKRDAKAAKAKEARDRLKKMASRTKAVRSIHTESALIAANRRQSELLNEAILDTLRLNEIDEAGADKRNAQTKQKIEAYQAEERARAEERERLLSMRLNAAEISAKFNNDNPFGLDRNFLMRTIKKQNAKIASHADHIYEIRMFKKQHKEESEWD